MSIDFHTLKVCVVCPETAEAMSIRVDVPEALMEVFRFKPGQHLTLKCDIGGEEVRRNYSLCVAPEDDQLKVTVKRIAGGLFSNWANDNLKPGDAIEVMAPHGSFTWDFDPAHANHYVGFAGRSEEHTSELQSLMRISYAVFCLKKKIPLLYRLPLFTTSISHPNLHIQQ